MLLAPTLDWCCCTAGVVPNQQLLQLLQQGGEPMAADELQRVLQTLTGAETPESATPALMDAQTFTREILGFAG